MKLREITASDMLPDWFVNAHALRARKVMYATSGCRHPPHSYYVVCCNCGEIIIATLHVRDSQFSQEMWLQEINHGRPHKCTREPHGN